LNKHDGKVAWSHDLWGEAFGGNVLSHGYSSSPVAYKDTVIVPIGGEKAALVAFEQATGSVRWQGHRFENSYSSPLVAEVAGETQLLLFTGEDLIGVNPDTGVLRWSYPHANQWRHNINLPAVTGGDTIFLSSPQAGARGLQIVRDGDALKVEEIWSTRRLQFYHGASVRDGDWVYGTTGTGGPGFMVAVNIRTGEEGWRERGFAKANCLGADGKLVVLDGSGVLYLVDATPEKLVIHARTQLLEGTAWTVPTLVGKTIYVRDGKRILAVNLG
jgi:outer membrane protein assembly factor BamB